jgi:hypothetical protein
MAQELLAISRMALEVLLRGGSAEDPRDLVAQNPRDSIAKIAGLREEFSRVLDLRKEERSCLTSRDSENTSLSSSQTRDSATAPARHRFADPDNKARIPVSAPDGHAVGLDGLDELIAPLTEACRRARRKLLNNRGRTRLGRLSEVQLREGVHRALVLLESDPTRTTSPFGLLIHWADTGQWEQFSPPPLPRPSPAPEPPAATRDPAIEQAEAHVDALEADPTKRHELAELDRAIAEDGPTAHPLAGRAQRLGRPETLHERRVSYLARTARRQSRAHPPPTERTATQV